MKMTGAQILEGGGALPAPAPATATAIELLAGLADLHKALATADTEDTILAAVARHRDRWRGTPDTEQTLAEIQALYGLSERMARAEEALRGAQRGRLLQETILDHMSVGVLLADAQTGEVLRMNRRLVSLMQFDSAKAGAVESFARRTFKPGTDVEIFPQEWPMTRSRATGERVEAEHDVLRPDGTRVTLHVVASPIVDERGTMVKCLVLFTDISDRRRAELERLQIQEELIRAQAAALAERSNPLIPISKDIVVMPVIGSLDVSRGQEMLTALLEGASRARARFAIIDVTGARMVDASAASALMGAAKALRLLGIEPVLTGVRPEIAQTFVSLGLDLGDMVMRGTLESGITYANQRLGAS